MTFDALRSSLGAGPLISLTTLLLIAVLAASFSAKQLSSFRTFELLRYIESRDHIAVLSVVNREIRPISTSEWWLEKDNERLVEAASEVASIYDMLYAMVCRLDHETKSLFYSNWADAIVRTHDALESYIEHRRRDPRCPSAYKGFSDLAAAVRSYAVSVP